MRIIKSLTLIIIIIAITNLTVIANTYTLPETLKVKNDNVYLNDIFEGIHINKLVTKAARPGYSKKVSKRYLALLMKRLDNNVKLKGPEFLTLVTESQNLDIENLKRKISEKILSKLNYNRSDISISFRKINYAKKLPLGKVETKISFSKTESFKGAVIAYVEIYVNGNFFNRTYIRTDVRIWANALLLTTNVKWNQPISGLQTVSKKVEITNVKGDLVELKDLKNYLAKKNTLAGTIITTEILRAKPLILSGDKVKVISKSANVIVSTIGVANENGYLNKTIRVKNMSTGRLLTCKVLDKCTVIIN